MDSSKPSSNAMFPFAPEESKRKPTDGDARVDATKKLRSAAAPVDQNFSFQYPVKEVPIPKDRWSFSWYYACRGSRRGGFIKRLSSYYVED